MKTLITRFSRNKDGAAAIEAAIVFPLLISCLFIIFGIGTYIFGIHQAQRIVEETAREVRMVHNPNEEELQTMLSDNMRSPFMGKYSPEVKLLSQFDGNYVELKVTYDFKFDFPFIDNVSWSSASTTQVKMRSMPS